MPRIVTTTIAASLGALILSTTAVGQDALGGGDALDGNLHATQGTRNVRGSVNNYRARNLLVTGNAVAGRGFRGSVGYTSAYDFRGETGSDDLFSFRAESALSSAEFLQLGSTYTQLRFGQNIGLLSYHRATEGNAGPSPVQMEGMTSDLRTRANIQLDRMSMISSMEGAIEVNAEPMIVGEVAGEQNERLLIHASSLQGTYPLPMTAGAQILGITSFDIARAGQDQQAGVMTYGLGSPFEHDFKPTIDGMLDTRVGERVEEREDTGDYSKILRTIADRYGITKPEEADQLNLGMDGLRDYLQGDDPPADPAATPIDRNTPVLPGGLQLNDPEDDDDADDDDDTDPSKPRTAAEILRHGQEIVTLTREKKNRFDELVAQGEDYLRKGEYFRAERRFEHALRFVPGHPMASAGLGHSQLGAELYYSASQTLRRVLQDNPELIDARYDVGLIAPEAELRRMAEELRGEIRTHAEPEPFAFLLAYVGHHLDDRATIDEGLSILKTSKMDDRLLPLLDQVWTHESDE